MLERVKTILKVPFSKEAIYLPQQFNNAELFDWLSAVGGKDIEVEWPAEQLTIYGAHNLAERQKGYGAITKQKTGNWQPSWVVIGDIHADPIIFNFSSSPCNILFARHGQGRWEARPLAGSTGDFARALTIWCEMYYIKFGKKILDDEFEVKDSFKKALSDDLSHVLNKEEAETFIFAVAG
ncbi:MAG: hypothetical protein P4L91_04575 [Burkholderiaceae bacterium]|nr:hypothetical protein [Burkholderiaceae bacterium]